MVVNFPRSIGIASHRTVQGLSLCGMPHPLARRCQRCPVGISLRVHVAIRCECMRLFAALFAVSVEGEMYCLACCTSI